MMPERDRAWKPEYARTRIYVISGHQTMFRVPSPGFASGPDEWTRSADDEVLAVLGQQRYSFFVNLNSVLGLECFKPAVHSPSALFHTTWHQHDLESWMMRDQRHRSTQREIELPQAYQPQNRKRTTQINLL